MECDRVTIMGKRRFTEIMPIHKKAFEALGVIVKPSFDLRTA